MRKCGTRAGAIRELPGHGLLLVVGADELAEGQTVVFLYYCKTEPQASINSENLPTYLHKVLATRCACVTTSRCHPRLQSARWLRAAVGRAEGQEQHQQKHSSPMSISRPQPTKQLIHEPPCPCLFLYSVPLRPTSVEPLESRDLGDTWTARSTRDCVKSHVELVRPSRHFLAFNLPQPKSFPPTVDATSNDVTTTQRAQGPRKQRNLGLLRGSPVHQASAWVFRYDWLAKWLRHRGQTSLPRTPSSPW